MSLPIRYPIPAQQTQVEIEIERSRFIATGTYTPTVEEAKAWLKEIRAQYADASHNCPAYLVGYGNNTTDWASDDGEPSGTAGRPMLAVLQGHDIGDISVMVTRYFGGTKLGTGGLVRAYGGAVRALLDVLPTTMMVERTRRLLAVDYARYQQLKALLLDYEADIQEEDFGTDITFEFLLPVDQSEALDKAITEFSNGQLAALNFDD